MSEPERRSVAGQFADDIILGCGWIFMAGLVVITLFCWAAGWNGVAGFLTLALVLGFTRGR